MQEREDVIGFVITQWMVTVLVFFTERAVLIRWNQL